MPARGKRAPYRRITAARKKAGDRLRATLDSNLAGPQRGAPSKYRPGFCELATSFCLLGATNEELGARFGVTKETIQDWMRTKEEFRNAVHEGRDGFDEKVAAALGHRAIGFSHPEEVIHFDKAGGVHRAKTRKQYPPDTAAAKFWLTNRRAGAGIEGNTWRERVEHTGDGGGPIDMTVNFVKAATAKAK